MAYPYVTEGPPTPVSEFRPDNEFKLCQACANLDLRAQDFIVARIPDGNDYETPIPGRLFRGSSRRLATRRQIIANHKFCPLCALIVRSLELNPTNAKLRDDDELSVRFEIDGRRQDSSDEPARLIDSRGNRVAASENLRRLTRRLRLTWGTPQPDDIYLMLVAPDTYHRANHDLAGNWDTKALFLGRSIDTAKSNEVLMLSWLQSCSTHHGSRCNPSQGENLKMLRVAESSWFAVIDVFNMRLRSLPTRTRPSEHGPYAHEPYAILSYVWGSTSDYTTKKSNVLFHQSPGGLEDRWGKLPETVRNAIQLTKTIGLRYIWVDRLCIIQDSPRSVRLNINEMDTIYSNAVFTICAADGADAGVGLRALRPEQRQQTKQMIQRCGRVNLMATQLAECAIQNSVWDTRAWTFQERMLSKRSFIFCQGRVYFQCRQSTMAEDIVAEPQGGGWSLELAQSPHQILHQLQKRPMVMYMECVSLYSKRQLSNSEDILSAFNGIENILQRAMNAPMVHGLPTSHFDLALLWQSTKIVKRRSAGQAKNRAVVAFPSWAWCGWQPSEVGQNNSPAIEYSSSVLEGCFHNAREFLADHTWIDYFIRDDQGELRPIWGSSSQSSLTVVEERWRGYDADLQKHRGRGLGRDRVEHYHENTMMTTRHLDRPWTPPDTHFPPYPLELTHSLQNGSPPRGQDHYIEAVRESKTSVHRNRQAAFESYSEPPQSPRLESERAWSVHDHAPDDQLTSDAPGKGTRILPPYEADGIFQRVYADSPYRVREADPNRKPTSETPDQAILQFWTLSTHLYLYPAEPRSKDMSDLQRFDILDLAGDWCGSILLDPDCELLRDHTNDFGEPRRYEFIALSEAKGFTLDECRTWTYYSPNNRDQSEWELYHCLLVEEDDEQHVMYRVGLGKVFRSAFRSWKEVILG